MKTPNADPTTEHTARIPRHTPGPWHVAFTHESNPFITNSTGKLSVSNSINGQTTDEVFYNARLIASAPELLEALEGLLNHQGPPISVPAKGDCWGFALPCELVTQARAAIAKAKGETK